MGLVLDSSVVIDAERRGDNVKQLLEQIVASTGDQRAVLSSIGLTELVHGIYRADNLQIRGRRESFVRDLIGSVEVYPFTRETALLAGRIDGEQRSRGIVVPFVDLLIGATALAVSYSLVTANARHFRLIPGLKVLQI